MLPAMRRLAAGIALSIATLAAPVLNAAPAYTPQVGQSGKDVIWVPTPEALAERMLTMAQVQPGDTVIDLGSGDGRLALLAASKFGARARGIEYNADLVALSNRAAKTAGLESRVRFEQADIFKIDLGAATVVTLYLLPAINKRLRPLLLKMRPGTRIVSHQFTMEDWQPDETTYVEQRAAHLWIVPAPVAGGWLLRMPDGTTWNLDLEQKFQHIDGRAEPPATPLRIGLREARLRGDILRFSLVDPHAVTHTFVGRITGDRIAGTVTTADTTRPWSATRRAPTDE